MAEESAIKKTRKKSKKTPKEKKKTSRPSSLQLGQHLIRALVAAVVFSAFLTLFDVGLSLANFGSGVSSLSEAALLFIDAFRLLLLGGIGCALFAGSVAVFLRLVGAPFRWRVTPSRVVSLFVGLCVSAILGQHAWGFIDRSRLEFTAIGSAYDWMILVLVGLGTWLTDHCSQGWLARAAQRFPRLFSARLIGSLFVFLVTTICTLVAQHAAAPVYEHRICLLLGLCPTILAIFIALWVTAPPSRSMTWGATGVGALLLLTWPFSSNHAVKFTLHGHVPLAGSYAAMWRSWTDIDGDGSTAWYWGGNDCAPSNPQVSPLTREIVGDNIDQDCQGGDAKSAEAIERPPLVPECTRTKEPLDHIILLTIDALRADAITPSLMPSLYQLGKQASYYSRAYPPSGSTEASTLGITTGRAVSDFLTVYPQKKYEVSDELLTAKMASAGFQTAVFIPFDVPPQLRRGAQLTRPKWLDFQPHLTKTLMGSAALLGGAAELIEHASEPQRNFIWIHLPDLHAPYPKTILGREDLSDYEQALMYVDANVGLLLSTLQQSGALERTAIVVSSDHGEQLGERGYEGHGTLLFEEGIHVPLIIHVPGCDPVRSADPVSLIYLKEFIERIALSPAPKKTSPEAAPYVVVEEGALSALGLKRAVIGRRYKLIHDVLNGGRVAFDLKEDPLELQNILPSRAADLEPIQSYYQSWLDSASR